MLSKRWFVIPPLLTNVSALPGDHVHVSAGIAQTLVRKGGITNNHLIAYSLSNVSAENYQNRLMCVEVRVCDVSVFFSETQFIVIMHSFVFAVVCSLLCYCVVCVLLQKILFLMCAGNELFYCMLYLTYFTSGPQGLFCHLSMHILWAHW